MITRFVFLGMLLATYLVASPLAADTLCHDIAHGVHVPNCACKRCCDDYDCKPFPAARCVKATCCDDYCPKPYPCAIPVKRFCCDDYCPKRPPCVVCPPNADLKCPPPAVCSRPKVAPDCPQALPESQRSRPNQAIEASSSKTRTR